MTIAKEPLTEHLDRLHTTERGIIRVRNNLGLGDVDVVGWCQERIASPKAAFVKRGKNWYIEVEGCVITVNASSYTIITAHQGRGSGG